MIEGEYYALEIDKWGQSNPTLRKRTLRNLEPNELLIRVWCTTIHPTDYVFMKGEYGVEKPYYHPIVPGFEGSGEIVKVGDLVNTNLIGKRCGVLANSNKMTPFDGLWAQYYYATLSELILFDDDIDYEKICFTINPLSALGMFDTIKKSGATSILQNGATSTLARMLHKLCSRNNITTINIVKDKNSMDCLSKCNIPNLINQGDNNWEKEVQKLCAQFNTKIGFDCVGGSYTAQLFANMPSQSILYHHGNLQEKDLAGLHSRDLIFYQRILAGWWLPVWLTSLPQEELAYYINFFKSEIHSSSDLFETEISKSYSLKEFGSASSDYSRNMDKGKVLIKPQIPID
jgi:NADPH:quinone reductase-like Zn-dependent oxidoreductase